jgi:hypothetical protein
VGEYNDSTTAEIQQWRSGSLRKWTGKIRLSIAVMICQWLIRVGSSRRINTQILRIACTTKRELQLTIYYLRHETDRHE